MAQLCKLHGLNVNEWDSRDDSQRGHIQLRWSEPKLGLGVVAVLTRHYLTVDIARAERSGRTQSLRLLQKTSSTNLHRYACPALREAVQEIRDYRSGSRLAEQLQLLKGQKKRRRVSD